MDGISAAATVACDASSRYWELGEFDSNGLFSLGLGRLDAGRNRRRLKQQNNKYLSHFIANLIL